MLPFLFISLKKRLLWFRSHEEGLLRKRSHFHRKKKIPRQIREHSDSIYIYFLPWNSMQSLPSRLQALFHLKVKPKRQQLSCSALSHKKSLYSKAKRLQHIQHINLVGRSSIPFTFLILVVVVALNWISRFCEFFLLQLDSWTNDGSSAWRRFQSSWLFLLLVSQLI